MSLLQIGIMKKLGGRLRECAEVRHVVIGTFPNPRNFFPEAS
jgi:hypothetical protein